jgi:glycogen(starch) synthase
MNILIFTTVFYPAIGGIENMTVNLAKEFIKEGHHVKVITHQKPAIPLANIKTYHSPSYLKMIRLFMWSNVYYMPNISLKGVWLLMFNPFKKWIVSHNDFYLGNTKQIEVKIKRLLIKFASCNIAVSKSVASKLNTKSQVVYNCYDETIFKLYEDEKRIYDFVFVGRLVSQKGCEILIKACKGLNAPFTLNIIGDGFERHRLEQLVDDLELTEHIHFLGFLKGNELARMLNRHKVLVVPSIGKEGFGIVALEGMACGCRIITADAGGLHEALDKFGKIFPMSNVEALNKLLKEEMAIEIDKSEVVNSELKTYLSKHTAKIVAKKYLYFFSKK